jgi:hypothetical protein
MKPGRKKGPPVTIEHLDNLKIEVESIKNRKRGIYLNARKRKSERR